LTSGVVNVNVKERTRGSSTDQTFCLRSDRFAEKINAAVTKKEKPTSKIKAKLDANGAREPGGVSAELTRRKRGGYSGKGRRDLTKKDDRILQAGEGRDD